MCSYAAVGVASIDDAMVERGLDGLLDGPPQRLGPATLSGTVLIHATGGAVSGLGGLIVGTAAARGLAGAVTDGLVRDLDEIEGSGFPVRYQRAHARAVRGSCAGDGHPVRVGGVEIAAGAWPTGTGSSPSRTPTRRQCWTAPARSSTSNACGWSGPAPPFPSRSDTTPSPRSSGPRTDPPDRADPPRSTARRQHPTRTAAPRSTAVPPPAWAGDGRAPATEKPHAQTARIDASPIVADLSAANAAERVVEHAEDAFRALLLPATTSPRRATNTSSATPLPRTGGTDMEGVHRR